MTSRPIICAGEALIDLVSLDPGAGIGRVRAFAPASGGAPANVAVGIARLGASAAFVGRLARDPFGQRIAEDLRANGVDVSMVRFDHRAHTALAFVALDADGEREFLFYREGTADTMLAPEDVDRDRIVQAAALHVGTVSLSREPSASATRIALAAAAAPGVLRSCDVNLRPLLWRDPAEMIAAARALVASCDVVKATLDEAGGLTGASDPEAAARALVDAGARLAVVTCGQAGAAFATSDRSGMIPGLPMRAIDTTGAGDAFMAALLVELTRDDIGAALDDPLRVADALRVANAAGALATQRRGAIPALPTRAEVDALLATRGPAPIAR